VSDVRVFVSFDLEHDVDLCSAMLAQSREKGSGFEVSASSEPREMSDPWQERQRRLICAADEVIVVCGEHTADSMRMSAELRIVQEESKPYFLLWGRRGTMCTRPTGARSDDSMYSWTPEILRSQIAWVLRKDQPIEVPNAVKAEPRARSLNAPPQTRRRTEHSS
jgi:hypothetical protein